jgi:hypothetical protein
MSPQYGHDALPPAASSSTSNVFSQLSQVRVITFAPWPSEWTLVATLYLRKFSGAFHTFRVIEWVESDILLGWRGLPRRSEAVRIA